MLRHPTGCRSYFDLGLGEAELGFAPSAGGGSFVIDLTQFGTAFFAFSTPFQNFLAGPVDSFLATPPFSFCIAPLRAWYECIDFSRSEPFALYVRKG